jgi:hypothetical protein
MTARLHLGAHPITDALARFDLELRLLAWELARTVLAAELARRQRRAR